MESEFLENLWLALQIATESFTEIFYFLHPQHKFFTWLASDILDKLVRFVNFKGNFLNRNLHSFGKELSLVFIEILGLDLSFFDVVSIIAHMSFDKSMQLSLFNVVFPSDLFRVSLEYLVKEEILDG